MPVAPAAKIIPTPLLDNQDNAARTRRKSTPYIDGYVCAVPTANKEAYRRHAELAAPLFKELGALSVVEGWGDDVPDGTLTSLPMAVQKKPDETVVFSWVTWPDKATRDSGWARMMEDPRMKAMGDMPFDGKRMIFGGFEVILEA